MRDKKKIIICGAGFAGQTLARQLVLRLGSKVEVTLIDARTFPTKDSRKLGESTIDISGNYLAEELQLKEYLDKRHIRKFGFRFFLNHLKDNLTPRPEIGLSEYTTHHSYQIDRQRFENDLFAMNVESGIRIIGGAKISDISIGKKQHVLSWKDSSGTEYNQDYDWVIDATGRQSFLAQKYNLHTPCKTKLNAVSFTIDGIVDIDKLLASKTKSNTWHSRIKGGPRSNSTNHLLGDGYWVWIIPLSSGATSVGVVSLDEKHDLKLMDSQDKVREWINKNELVLGRYLDGHDFKDFIVMKNYSYETKQFISADRWACIGNAAAFSDPFYSPGGAFIAFENSLIVEAIERDLNSSLSKRYINHANSFISSLGKVTVEKIHTNYMIFKDPIAFTLSYIWDLAHTLAFPTKAWFSKSFLDEKSTMQNYAIKAAELNRDIKERLAKATVENRFEDYVADDFFDYYKLPLLKKVHDQAIHSSTEGVSFESSYHELSKLHHSICSFLKDSPADEDIFSYIAE